jgi:hypothetical protein
MEGVAEMSNCRDEDDADVYYETVASEEEIYLEETEEEVFEVLITEDESMLHKNQLNRTCFGETLSEQRIHAAEELITGDSDDPPLSQDEVSKLLGQN